ncbi:Alpha-D-ribose 1-methylphosphonate 5-triphosphate synthase subunit PhnH [Andreprevotia sp. IGB-42]|uniref:phosphonate C-P lyase system protein PhnH n=1 Tax=Andreprevotia sp. IGB-42 TaxID=2497473 RepID=UPI0013596D40|nr:phosphonate C-P lyase system protein PhnH [Andreprevotia sp. IGB-42]KAF0813867.1 Alpha-D-ribose 1-methylphosphonate 5-triphosphate synthase subunit PhnH [Andreprevotia sp. IGB-42]
MNAPHTPLLPGLPQPAPDSQRIFRQLLDAMAQPGRIHALQVAVTAPAPLAPAASAIALTLCDYETPVWLQSAGPEAWLRFHSGCPLVDDPGTARFALIDQPASMPALAAFAQGEAEYPDRSATLIIQVSAFGEQGLVFAGPGIDGETRLGVAGLPDQFWRDWQQSHGRFPLGVDLVLVAGTRFLCIPRTTTVREG